MSKELFDKVVNQDPSVVKDIKERIYSSLDIKYELKEASSDKTEFVNINDIKPGDVIIFNGKERTVSKKDISRDGFHGTSIFGDSFKSGRTKVERVLYKKWRNGKFVGYVP